MDPPGQTRGTLKTRLRPLGSGEVRPTQKHRRRHLAEAGDAFIPGQGRGLLRRRIKPNNPDAKRRSVEGSGMVFYRQPIGGPPQAVRS